MVAPKKKKACQEVRPKKKRGNSEKKKKGVAMSEKNVYNNRDEIKREKVNHN